MNEELKIKFENLLGLNEDNILNENMGTIVYVNYKECYQVVVSYNENQDCLNGVIYFNFGNENFIKTDNFKFYNTIVGDFEFENNFNLDWFKLEDEIMNITFEDSSLYPKGLILDFYPIYVHYREENNVVHVRLNNSIQDSYQRIDNFMVDNF